MRRARPTTRTPVPIALAVRLLPADTRADVEAELVARHAEMRARRGVLASTRWALRQPFAAFVADPEWKAARDASEKDGKIVEKVESVFLTPTDYSPMK